MAFTGNDADGYGLYVDISHGDGYRTRYAHLSSIDVQVGETVGQGQVIGVSGDSGVSSGPHLHFEIWRKGRRVNPLSILP